MNALLCNTMEVFSYIHIIGGWWQIYSQVTRILCRQPENVPASLPDNIPAPLPDVQAPLPAHLVPLPAAPGIVEAAPVLRTADNSQDAFLGHTETVQNEGSDDSLMSTLSDLIYEMPEVSSDRSQSPHFFDLKTANHSQQLASDHLYAGPCRSERTLPYSGYLN
ncbi:uncharacterized protein LOC127749383 [Frankliniella occidentalis]|uniref:Uncharacterized protein LOC127749383 n=1 Tax=Frankliniella occidentalis TaxID=133901 RepID=A0A9C6U8G4_FRAOC|nr:uncharacterized protein LOC127749383 [Frankliniella occidentalis]